MLSVLNSWIGYTNIIFSSIADFVFSVPVVYFVVAFLLLFVFRVFKSFMR